MNSIVLIAIVEDDRAVRDGIDNLVRSFGFQTCRYSSAESYLDSDHAADVDCLITDVQMSGMSGLDLQRLLCARGGAPPIIIVTASAQADIVAQAMTGGAIACLHKPFDDALLFHSIEQALALR